MEVEHMDWIWIAFPAIDWHTLIVYTNVDNKPITILGCFLAFDIS